MNQFVRLLDAATEPTADATQQLIFTVGSLIFFGVVLYFMVIRPQKKKEKDRKTRDEYIDRKISQLEKRRRKKDTPSPDAKPDTRQLPLKVGEKVRMKDNGMVGEVSKVSSKAVTVIIGNISSSMAPERLERISSNEFKESTRKQFKPVQQKMDASISERKLQFKPEIDIRGARLSDALDAVTRYIDDAIMLNIGMVRIIHGKGTGVLREEIQKYLRTVPGLTVKDEDIRQGGTGVTIVTFD